MRTKRICEIREIRAKKTDQITQYFFVSLCGNIFVSAFLRALREASLLNPCLKLFGLIVLFHPANVEKDFSGIPSPDRKATPVFPLESTNDYGNMFWSFNIIINHNEDLIGSYRTRPWAGHRRHSKGFIMEKKVSKSEFKPKALRFFREIEQTGEALTITDRGKPVLKIVPYSENPEDTLRMLRNSVIKYENPLDPVGVNDWESLK